jgi:hypothetical protein
MNISGERLENCAVVRHPVSIVSENLKFHGCVNLILYPMRRICNCLRRLEAKPATWPNGVRPHKRRLSTLADGKDSMDY